jgi:hypothetical protein
MMSCLPTEVRLLIVSCLRHDGCSLARLSAVSHEWRHIIEPLIFSRIILTPSRLPMFNLIAHRMRRLIRSIWLRIDLEHDMLSDAAANSELIRAVFKSLLTTLSSWGPSEGGLTLDISTLTPADSAPCFAHIPRKPDLTLRECKGDQELGRIVPALAPPTAELLEEAFDFLLDGDDKPLAAVGEQLLPSVPVVTSVVLRQQNRLRCMPFDLGQILSRMPRLQQIHYEPWRQWDQEDQEMLDDCKDSFFFDFRYQSFALTLLRQVTG